MSQLRKALVLITIVVVASSCSSRSRAPESKAGAPRLEEEQPDGAASGNQGSRQQVLDGETGSGGLRGPLKASPYRGEAERAVAAEARVRLPADLARRSVSARAEDRARAVLACLVLDRERHDARRGRAIAAELAQERAVSSSFVLDGWQGEQTLAALGSKAASRKADYLLVLQEGERRAVMIFAPKDLALLARSGASPAPIGDSALASVFRRACRIWDAR